jgi:hypothetical protein
LGSDHTDAAVEVCDEVVVPVPVEVPLLVDVPVPVDDCVPVCGPADGVVVDLLPPPHAAIATLATTATATAATRLDTVLLIIPP